MRLFLSIPGRPAPARQRWLWCVLVMGHRWQRFDLIQTGGLVPGEFCTRCHVLKLSRT